MRIADYKEIDGKIIAGKFMGVRREPIRNKKGELIFYRFFIGVKALNSNSDFVYRISINEDDLNKINFPKLETNIIIPVVDYYNKKNFHSLYIDTEKLGLKKTDSFERLDLVECA